MTDPVTCPHCREALDIPAEFRGRDVRCATCQTVFAVPSADAGPPAVRSPRPDADPTPRRYRDDPALDRPRRRGNGGVWALLLFTLVAFGGCVAGCLGLSRFMYFPKMHPYTSAEGKFRVEFPGDPSPTVTAPEPGAVTVVGQRLAQERYVAKCYKLPLKQRFAAKEDVLTEAAEKELAAEGVPTKLAGKGPAGPGAEADHEFTTHGGFDALDVRASVGQGLSRRATILRCVRAGNTMYVVLAQGPNMEAQMWYVRHFFLSFELTDPPAARPDPKPEPKGD